jgi:peptidyl-prolyl cis-trans isomerase SurA
MKLFKVAIIALALLTLPFSIASAETQHLDGVAAIVNKDIITVSELQNQMNLVKSQLKHNKVATPSPAALKKQVLNHLIDVKLQLQAAERFGVTVSNADLNKAVRSVAKRNHLTMTQLRAKVIESGLTYPAYRENLRKEITLARLQREAVGNNIKITRQQLDDFVKGYQRYNNRNTLFHVQNILIALPEAPTPQQIQTARAEAQKVIAQLAKGDDFSKVAVAKSGDTFALKGGDLGWRHITQLPDAFARHVTSMKAGQVSKPIRTPNGFHIIKLVGEKAGAKQALNRAQLKNLLYQRQVSEKAQDWVQKLRSHAYIKIKA